MENPFVTFLQAYDELSDTFDLAKDYFNNLDWNSLENKLDDDVLLKRIGKPHPDDLVRGKTKVMNFLRKETKDHPSFKPKTKIVDTVLGAVSGIAGWKDDHGKEDIRYFFLFSKQGDGSWKLLFLWGSAAL